MNFTQNNFIVTTNTQETSSTVLSKNSFKRAACRTLFTDKSPSPVNRSKQINLREHIMVHVLYLLY